MKRNCAIYFTVKVSLGNSSTVHQIAKEDTKNIIISEVVIFVVRTRC